MPRYIVSRNPPSPGREKYVKKLVQEFSGASTNMQPLILEEQVPSTRSRHMHVIWDAWKDLDDEERAAVIIDAYTQAEGPEIADSVMVAEGATPREALALGLLPYKVVMTRKADERIPLDDYRAAQQAEARKTLLGSKAKELRYARFDDAEQAQKRLHGSLPGSSWAVVQEVGVES